MYEKSEYRYDWSSALKKLGIIIIIGIIILVVIFFVLNAKPKTKTNSFLEDNLNTMLSVATAYYKNNELATDEKITLKEMIDHKMLIDFIDENGNNCDHKASYARLRNNRVKVYLKCDYDEDSKEINI